MVHLSARLVEDSTREFAEHEIVVSVVGWGILPRIVANLGLATVVVRKVI
jgi:hypothetical protein